ncbi:PLP-dependent aminotransferase family protein [Streptomyces scopuliridis]|uniref:MocR-like pyridoxine biosynthesis transcription factor PdxR n=1 Tax=Streptomyces scopuliridis TaxID=452529 RepID=UPI00367D826C
MAESWGNSAEGLGSDLHLELTGPGGRRAALTRALREAVRSGRLAAGTRLPPYRSLAADLGLARNTVAAAYAKLVAEGRLTARQGSGTRVARRVAPVETVRRRRTPERSVRPPYDLVQGQPDPAAVPRAAWLASARRALTVTPHDAFGPGDPRGRAELRRELAGYLARVRGVGTDPERIVICSGAAHALRLLAAVAGGTWAVEAYGLPFHRELLHDEGVRTVPVSVDEHGARVDEWAATGAGGGARAGAANGAGGRAGVGARAGAGIEARAGAVLLTPAHQFPTGGPLRPERRAAVVDWARSTGGLVVEDDYDGEFRYDRRPVGAVQGLAPERVVLLGSVSKSLSPTLRIGWMVLPERLVDEVVAAKGEREQWSSATEQLTLADFIGSGAYDRHIRKMRLRHRRRRDRLVEVVSERAPLVRVTGIAAGLHAVLELPPGTERSVVRAAAWQGLAVEGLAGYRHPESRAANRDGLVVGYATPPERGYEGALDVLCRALPPGR